MNLGLTGGIGCGKSAVGRHLKQLGLLHLDTDIVARDVVKPGTPGLAQVVERFGASILTSSGELDRAQLGEIVFSDPSERKALEQILHPLIWTKVSSFLKAAILEGADSVVEVPLLYEKGRQDTFDQVWVVATTKELQIERLAKRNGWSSEEARARIRSQMPLQEKIELADRVIWNNGDLQDLERTVTAAWAETGDLKPS